MANASPESLSDDGEITGENTAMEFALKRVGEDCLAHRQVTRLEKRNITAAGMVFGGIALFFSGAMTHDEGQTNAGYTLMLLGLGLCKREIPDPEETRLTAKIALLSLGLEESYVERHFSKIVNTISKKYEPKKVEADRIKLEQEAALLKKQQDDQVVNMRRQFGLPNVESGNLDTLLKEQFGSAPIDKTKQSIKHGKIK